jgi:CRISPR-associated protein Cas2
MDGVSRTLCAAKAQVMARRWYLIAYDVRDDLRLRRTARLLEGYGDRVQYSVFRCRLTSLEIERLRWELSMVLEKEDDLMILPLCDRCSGAVARHGFTTEEKDELYRIV